MALLGLAHWLQRKTITKACHSEYPQINKQINERLPHEKDMLSLLCDHLLDIDFLKKDDEETDPHSNQAHGPQIEKSQLNAGADAIHTQSSGG